MRTLDFAQIKALSTSEKAKHMLRWELAKIDAVTLKLAGLLPSLVSLEIQIVQESDSLERPIFQYLCSLELGTEERKIAVGTLSLEEGMMKSLASYAVRE